MTSHGVETVPRTELVRLGLFQNAGRMHQGRNHPARAIG